MRSFIGGRADSSDTAELHVTVCSSWTGSAVYAYVYGLEDAAVNADAYGLEDVVSVTVARMQCGSSGGSLRGSRISHSYLGFLVTSLHVLVLSTQKISH